jgi:SAM-dependent methyltransferase
LDLRGGVVDEMHYDNSRAFWDTHHHVNEDPTSWQAEPQCREAINRRVSGDPQAWPLVAFQWYIRRRFRRGLSLGSGLGNLERAARRINLCDEIEGVDASEVSLDIARARASEEGLAGISYRAGDLNSLRLQRARYDVVFFHASLHHVYSIERLLAQVERAMTPDGVLFLEEWVGPSRTEWNAARLAKMRALYAELPESWRVGPVLQPPIVVDDPSEAIRSSAILPAVRRLFHVIEERPYGGHLVAVILSQLCRDKVSDADRQALIGRLLALEEADLANDPSCSYHVVVVARRKTCLARASGHARTFLAQLGVSARYGIETAWQVVIAKRIVAARDTRVGRELVRRLRPLVRKWRAAR